MHQEVPVTQLTRREISQQDYERIHTSTEFAELRKRFRGFAFPMTVVFLVWYLLYVLMSAYATGFMSTKVLGNINVGLIFGLLQFLSTFVITAMYVRHSNKNTDPLADDLREQLEGKTPDESGTTEKGTTRA
ncbi:MAG: DUF485 domain-containing protein [Geodermatophilaceae bacterium]|nr:DUF485 domain-containing protein [Geodermatophilaceae bacterium]